MRFLDEFLYPDGIMVEFPRWSRWSCSRKDLPGGNIHAFF